MNNPGGRQTDNGEQNVIRTFVCIEIPQSIKGRIAELQEVLRHSKAQASWVPPAGIHLTLKFLGGVPAPKIKDVGEAVKRASRSIPPFEIEVSGTGCFPSPKSPRVLWVGLTTVPSDLARLQAAVEDELMAEGFPREKRRFSPHLTIARLRSQSNVRKLVEDLQDRGFEPEKFRAEEVVVMRSDLKPSGPIYSAQASVRLES